MCSFSTDIPIIEKIKYLSSNFNYIFYMCSFSPDIPIIEEIKYLSSNFNFILKSSGQDKVSELGTQLFCGYRDQCLLIHNLRINFIFI